MRAAAARAAVLLWAGVDTRATTSPVAPDAPPPTYDAAGNLVAEWMVTVRYDSVRDVINVTQVQEAGPYHKARVQTDTYAPTEVEAIASHLHRVLRILGARRLF